MAEEKASKTDDISYQEVGQGPVLVLLHGFGGSTKQWEAVATAMSKNYRVIVPNLSKLLFGTTHKTFFEQVFCLQELLLKISQGEPVHLAGSSYGGALSWAVAIRFPKLVKSLTLLGPMPPNPIPHFRSRLLKQVLYLGRWPALLWIFLKTPVGRRSLSRLAEIFHVPWLERKRIYKDKSPVTDRQLRVLVHAIHRFSRLLTNEDWSYWESRLSFIEHPVCIIWGERDRLYLEAEPSRFLRLFNNGQLHHLEDTGHFSMSENPLPVVYILDQFLTRFKKAA